MLENISMIAILGFFRLGMIHEESYKGLFIGIWKYDFTFSITQHKPKVTFYGETGSA
tara:strand:+ start:4011 stop:4181 length:171 start_codon:yes stop_codon:yes gene_type:complete